MHCHYHDLLALRPDPPIWFDEHGVPRWIEFHPRELATYAEECALLEVACQNCGKRFMVAVSWSRIDDIPRLSDEPQAIEYGDPPNVQCCPLGPTMNSVPIRVVEFWARNNYLVWGRRHGLEGDSAAWWMEGETIPDPPNGEA